MTLPHHLWRLLNSVWITIIFFWMTHRRTKTYHQIYHQPHGFWNHSHLLSLNENFWSSSGKTQKMNKMNKQQTCQNQKELHSKSAQATNNGRCANAHNTSQPPKKPLSDFTGTVSNRQRPPPLLAMHGPPEACTVHARYKDWWTDHQMNVIHAALGK